MAARLTWLCLLALVAIAAVPLQLDRSARDRPGLAKYVPAPFQGFSGYVLAAKAINLEDEDALDLARRELRWYPVPAENLTALSAAALQDGQQELALGALSISATRGWREPLAQQAMFEAAIQAGEWQIAADRLGALWVGGRAEKDIARILPRLLETRDGRAAFVAKLKTMPSLRDSFARWSAANAETGNLAQLFAEAHRQGVALDCGDLSLAAGNLIRLGKAAEAGSVWSGQCAGASKASGTNPEFTQQGEQAGGPFDWTFPDRAGLEAGLRRAGGRMVLDYRFGDPLTAVVAWKYASYTPGRYAIRLGQDQSVGVSSRPPALRVDCYGGSKGAVPLDLYRQGDGSQLLSIPGEGCSAQRIRLLVSRGEGKGLTLGIERLPGQD